MSEAISPLLLMSSKWAPMTVSPEVNFLSPDTVGKELLSGSLEWEDASEDKTTTLSV